MTKAEIVQAVQELGLTRGSFIVFGSCPMAAVGIREANDNWHFGNYNPSLEELLSRAMVVDGVDFASLEDVRKWKAASNLPKHDADIKLIDEYFAKDD